MKVLRACLRKLPLLEEVLLLWIVEIDRNRVDLEALTHSSPLTLVDYPGCVRHGLRELTRHVPALDLQVEIWLELSLLLLNWAQHRHLHVSRNHRVLVRDLEALVGLLWTVHLHRLLIVPLVRRQGQPLDAVLLPLKVDLPLFRLHFAPLSLSKFLAWHLFIALNNNLN